MGFYKGKAGSEIVDEAEGKTDGFKKGGRAKRADGGSAQNKSKGTLSAEDAARQNSMYKRGGKAVPGKMSEASACRKPRKSGGAVFSSAANGSPRKPSSHY